MASFLNIWYLKTAVENEAVPTNLDYLKGQSTQSLYFSIGSMISLRAPNGGD